MRSENFLLVAAAAARFACRPSRLVGLDDAVLALDFDLAAAARLIERERAACGGGLQPGNCPPEGGHYEGGLRAREERW